MIRTMSLRTRITLLLATAIVMTLGTATLVIDSRIDNELSQHANANLLERAQALSDVFQAQRDSFAPDGLPGFLADDGQVYFTIDCVDRHVASSPVATALAWPIAGLQPRFADLRDPPGNGLRAVVMQFHPSSPTSTSAAAAPPCTLKLALDQREVRSFQHSMDAIFIGSPMLAALAVVLLVPLLVGRGLRPLRDLAEAMRRIGPQTSERRLTGSTASELEPLTTRFNEVLSRMEEGLVRERRFARAAAHELRTPLTELRTLVEVELRYPSGRDLRELIGEIGSIGKEMERMVGALLLLTRIEAGIEQGQMLPVDIAALTRNMVERHRRDIQQRKLQVVAAIEPAVRWRGDAALIEVIIGNLLSNAVAYAPIGSTVDIACDVGRWHVTNAADGLTQEDVALMGQRFWRKDKEAGVHTGLGLALVHAAARAQQIEFRLSLTSGYLSASINPTNAQRETK